MPGSNVAFGFGLITCQRVAGDSRSDSQIYNEAIELDQPRARALRLAQAVRLIEEDDR